MLKVNVPGTQLSVIDQGVGLPVLFVHGFPLSHAMWRAQIDDLSTSCRVIAPDLRGFGNSGVIDGTVSMEQFADDLYSLLETLQIGTSVCLCGLSMGGYIAWEFFRNYRQCLNSLILCDTRASADTRQGVEGRRKLAASVMDHGPEFAVTAMRPKLFAPSTIQAHADIVDDVCRIIRETDKRSIAAASHGMAQRSDSQSLLEEIDLPTLVLVGESDQITTVDEMRQIADSISGSQFKVVRDAGHMAPMENPEDTNTAIRSFLGI